LGHRLATFKFAKNIWVPADLIGKGKHIRTVPMPAWVERAVDAWTEAAGISAGFIFRAVGRTGAV
jgi:hypothetical protein